LLKLSSDKWLYYILGSLCAAINGLVFPSFAFVFGNLIGLLYDLRDPSSNLTQVEFDVNMYCIGFAGIALTGGLTTLGYNFFFGLIGDSLVYKLRNTTFRKLMKMPVSYFDK
jgi:ABC-type multidrug transport system fused ATPase/permease subunit